MIVRSPLESDTHMKVEKINIVLAFIAVLLIWTTTPLAIKWSSGNAPMTSALLRMSIGVLFCLGLLAAFKHSLPFDKAARRVYLVGGVSIFVGMSLFYFAAQSIPSGWIAVLFGLSPLATGVFSAMLEPETRLTGVRIAGLCLGFAGLYLVFSAGLKFDEASLEGVIMTLMATLVTAATSVISRQLVHDNQWHANYRWKLVSCRPVLCSGGVLFRIPYRAKPKQPRVIEYSLSRPDRDWYWFHLILLSTKTHNGHSNFNDSSDNAYFSFICWQLVK